MVLSGDKKYFEINNRTILGFTDCEDKKSLKSVPASYAKKNSLNSKVDSLKDCKQSSKGA